MKLRLLAVSFVLGVGLLHSVVDSWAQTLTADRAVQIALEKNSQVINSEASLLDARSGLYGSYSLLLPRVSASWTRSGSWLKDQTGSQAFGGVTFPSQIDESESYQTLPQLTASWSPLNLSAFSSLSASRGGIRAAQLSRTATRNDVALSVRRQFYDVVQAIQITQVNAEALRLARDDERRVNALFEVGSVSKSDLLKARVRTAQAELDSLTAQQTVVSQRNRLAATLGMRDAELGEIDTLLTVNETNYDEPAIVTEARRNRPDLLAAEAEARAARASLRSANFGRLPYVTLEGSAQFNTKRSQRIEQASGTTSVSQKTDSQLGASVGLSWDVFDGFATDSRIASARARVLRADDQRDQLRRNLEGEVHEALVAYRAATEQHRVARRALESADENLKLTQQKYNVGSATILDLIDAQVQLQRSRSQEVAALAAIRVAEAAIDRVRGRNS